MKKTNLLRKLAALTAVLALASSLAGCSGGNAGHGYSGEPTQKTYTEGTPAPTESAGGSEAVETPEAAPSGTMTSTGALDRLERVKELQGKSGTGDADDSSQDPSVDNAHVTAPGTDAAFNSVESVAELGAFRGNMSFRPAVTKTRYDTSSKLDTTPSVDVDNAHNPYDLTWRYDDPAKLDTMYWTYEDTEKCGSWGNSYQEYVDACDWSLVFDVEYYKTAFPVLAQLYHDNNALLLEHFQTQGVHEGRQGSGNFNVAAYMAHCGEDLKTAFGDNYECYYFYYMLNQDTEKSVTTTGDYKTWQTVELSWYQNSELEHVNEYREEAGVPPVTVDPEMVAFANLRAYHDAVNNVRAHDAIYDQFVDDAMDNLGVSEFFENKTSCFSGTCPCTVLSQPWRGFYDSKEHYAAMVMEKQRYFGSSNTYMSSQSGTKNCDEFDVYAPGTPATSR